MEHLATFVAIFGAMLAVAAVLGGLCVFVGYAATARETSPPVQRVAARVVYGRRWATDNDRAVVLALVLRLAVVLAVVAAAVTATSAA